jgi:hypothetical protein
MKINNHHERKGIMSEEEISRVKSSRRRVALKFAIALTTTIALTTIKQLKTLEAGKVYDYKFDVDEIRGPIIAVVEESGWEWVPVTAKRHVKR